MTKVVDDMSFGQEVTNYKGVVLVDFWAEWCGPCRQLMPLIEQLSQEMGDKIKILKMNIDENTEVPTKFAVRAIPTLILFKDGKDLGTKVGGLSYIELKEWVESNCK